MIIDFHTHIFPQKIAQKALTHLSKGGGGFPYYYDGTPEALKQSMAEHGIDKSVVLNIATNPAQQRAVNDFAAAVNSPRLIAFGSVHPYAKDAIAEAKSVEENNAKLSEVKAELQPLKDVRYWISKVIEPEQSEVEKKPEPKHSVTEKMKYLQEQKKQPEQKSPQHKQKKQNMEL